MRKILFTFLFLITGSIFLSAQEIERIDAAQLQKLTEVKDNRLHVVNFWATWCSPCVKEIPGFKKASEAYPADKVDFLFVSLDFPSTAEKNLVPFIKDHNLNSRVVLMTGQNADSWIRMIDRDWQGDIPATLIYRTSDDLRVFHAGELNYDELKNMINNHL